MVLVAMVFHNLCVKVVTHYLGYTLEKMPLQKKQRNAMLHLLPVTYDNQTKELRIMPRKKNGTDVGTRCLIAVYYTVNTQVHNHVKLALKPEALLACWMYAGEPVIHSFLWEFP